LIQGFLNNNFPERPAIIADGSSAICYAELEESVKSIAKILPSKDLFFLVGSNDIPTITCYLASLNCGAVPLILGKELAADQLNRLIEIYNPRFIFISEKVGWDSKQSKLLWRLGTYGFYKRKNAAPKVLHENLALLMATSGSTGSPKLVRLSLNNVISNAESIIQFLCITPEERAITSLPFNYSYGLSVINSHLRAGASLVLNNYSLMDKVFWQQIRQHQVTSFAGVPYSYEILLKLRFNQIEMPSMRTLTQAGGRLDPIKMKQIHKICSEKEIKFVPMYGQTEATARISFLGHEDVGIKIGSIGKVIPGGELWIQDENGQCVNSPDTVGELVYAGPNVSMGYADCPEDLSLGDLNQGVLLTGDLGRFDSEGFFFIEGRKRRFLKIFGIRVSLDAVEEIVASKGWRCAAHGVDDSLTLFVVKLKDQDPNVLKFEMAECLGLHISAIQIRTLPDLPLLSSGKVDYKCLIQML
jgi:acyl-coenzyme A synthetase/AMP-(fatty) acid ligase